MLKGSKRIGLVTVVVLLLASASYAASVPVESDCDNPDSWKSCAADCDDLQSCKRCCGKGEWNDEITKKCVDRCKMIHALELSRVPVGGENNQVIFE